LQCSSQKALLPQPEQNCYAFVTWAAQRLLSESVLGQDAAMTSEQVHSPTVEQRLQDAIHAATTRRERHRRRQEHRKSHGLASFSKFGLDRHHGSEPL
jgi:hypothetical protein